MKRGWLALVMLAPMLAGCLSGDTDDDTVGGPPDVGYDAGTLTVSGVAVHDLEISSDNLTLSAILYEPLTQDSIDGEDPRWPLVVFVHPWGFPKETYENAPLSSDGSPGLGAPAGAPSEDDAPQTNLLQQFAENGIMAIAYDARGWGQSEGQSTFAGAGEMRDLRAVIDYANDNFLTNGRTGVTGASYGGGHAFRAWAEFDDVVTAVPHNGWTDLYHALAPGNVLKAQWSAELYAVGTAGGGRPASMSPAVNDWLSIMSSRQDADSVDGVHRQLDTRSILQRGVERTEKPLLTCGGLTDTLFNQNHDAWMHAPGEVKAIYFQGGHNTLDEECWTRTLEWFQWHLAGVDTGVDEWPFLQTVDASGNGGVRSYSKALSTSVDPEILYFREGQLVDYDDAGRTFTIEQRVASNPLVEPSGVYESTGQPSQDVPEQFREDPSGIQFVSPAIEGTATVLGAPTVTLALAEDTVAPFQVVATLYHKHDGSLTLIGQGATNPLDERHLDSEDGFNTTTTIQLPWTKLDLSPGDSFVVELSSSEPSMFTPYPNNFAATFTGASSIDIPFFAPPSAL